MRYDIRTGVKRLKTRTAAAFVSAAAISAGVVMFGAGGVPASAANNGKVPITAGPIARVNVDDTGTCNNTWALDSYNKFYSLALNNDGTYNLKINYKDGTFVTLEGQSPGACESGSDNGNTVAAGITGRMHQEWNATVTGTTTTPNRSPDCGGNNCLGSGGFLDAVFGPGNYTPVAFPTDWSYTGHFEAGSNGTWFDTFVNYPLNDRGDITSP